MIINCNSLKGPSRFSEFQVLRDFHKPDIILNCESKLDCEVPTYSVFQPTYSVFRKDRNLNGGGEFQATKSEIVCEEMPNFENDCEILWSSVKIGNCKTLHLASCYNSPQDVLEQFSDSFYCVFESCNHHPYIIAAGDFNLGDIDWSAEVPFANDSVTSVGYQNPDHWVAFKKQRNLVSRIVKESRSDYLNNVIEASLQENSKNFWPYVRSCKSEDIGIPPLRYGNNLCTSDKSKAEALISYFYSVFTQEKLPIPTKPTFPYNLISDIDISAHGVHKQLLQLNPRKACGPDEIPARVLKELAPSIAPWLSSIFQQSYDTGAVPSDWTKALVTANHKKDSKSNPANHRPISLTSLCCKVMEHIILSHISKHLAANNILIGQQHGFRQCFSCETQLFQQSMTVLDALTRAHKLT